MTTFTNPHERIEQLMQRVEELEAALRGLVNDVQGYAAWERPCLALDNAAKALHPLVIVSSALETEEELPSQAAVIRDNGDPR